MKKNLKTVAKVASLSSAILLTLAVTAWRPSLWETNAQTVLRLFQGGTGQNSWTASRCVQVNSGGTALESASSACGGTGGTFDSRVSYKISIAMPECKSGSCDFGYFGLGFDNGNNGCASGPTFQSPDSFSDFFRAAYTSGTTADTACGRGSSVGTNYPGDRVISMSWVVNLDSATSERMWLMASPTSCCGSWGTDSPSSSLSWLGILVSTTMSPTGAYCTASNGSSSTFTNMASGLGLDTSLHEYRWVYDPSGPDLTCTVDGGNSTVVSTNVPTAPSGYTPQHMIAPSTTSARTFNVMQVMLQEEWF